MKPSMTAQISVLSTHGKQGGCCLLEKLHNIFSNGQRKGCAIALALLLGCAREFGAATMLSNQH